MPIRLVEIRHHGGVVVRQSKKKNIYMQIATLVILMIIVLVSVSIYTSKHELKDGKITRYIFTKKVEKHRPLVEKYARENEVEDHVDVLLAMMMQESGGRGDDPMQASESLCGEVGCIDDPEKSIQQGITYFAKSLTAAKGDVELAVQAYNFGLGFVDYVHAEHQSFDEAVAIEFSQVMYQNAEDPSKYTCLREEAKQHEACYGDIYYARDVMNYKRDFVATE